MSDVILACGLFECASGARRFVERRDMTLAQVEDWNRANVTSTRRVLPLSAEQVEIYSTVTTAAPTAATLLASAQKRAESLARYLNTPPKPSTYEELLTAVRGEFTLLCDEAAAIELRATQAEQRLADALKKIDDLDDYGRRLREEISHD